MIRLQSYPACGFAHLEVPAARNRKRRRDYSMKSLFVALTFAAVLLAEQDAEVKPTWHKDWPTAQRIAKRDNKPIFAILVCQH